MIIDTVCTNYPKGYLVNCHIMSRVDADGNSVHSDALFVGCSDGTIVAQLYGYAIIPMEEYARLKGSQS